MLNVEYAEDKLIVNGIYVEESHLFTHLNKVHISIYNEKITAILIEEQVDEILKHFHRLKIPLLPQYYPKTISSDDWSYIQLIKNNGGTFSIEFTFQYDTYLWSFNYNMKSFVEKLEELCSNSPSLIYELQDEGIGNGFLIRSDYSNKNLPFDELIKSLSISINLLFEDAFKSFNNISIKDSLDFTFNLNDNIKIACQQYLVYFTQFLEDIGIDANSKISNETESILFSVTPNNPDVALKQIKEALEIYLALPNYSEDFDTTRINEIAVLQLQSNINHLNSQLVLAKATMIAQEKTMVAQEKTINLLELMNNQTLQDSNKPNEEELLSGIIKVKEYDKNGFKVDVPELARIMKRKFNVK